MRSALIFLLGIFCALASSVCRAQTVQVSDPRLELKDNLILISYDILNSDPSDRFIIHLSVIDADGNQINAAALSGDIGDGVSGGSNKLITWDLKADNIFMNSRISFKIFAKTIQVPKAVEVIQDTIPEGEDAKAADTETEGIALVPSDEGESSGEAVRSEIITHDVPAQEFNRAGIILQSIALPGLGLSRSRGNPHWLRGVAGYGCIAGAYLMNRKAISTYGSIADEKIYANKNKLFQRSQNQDNISEALAYAAIGIWVTDLIWTLVGTSDLRQKSSMSDVPGISWKTTVDPLTYTPLMGITYRF